MLKLSHVKKTFNKGTVTEKRALTGVDLTLNDGGFVTVIGGNGAGKSTLLNMIAGVYPLDSGVIELDGNDISRLSESQRAKYLGRVFQDPMRGTAADMQIAENLALAKRRGQRRGLSWGVTKAEKDEYIELLKRLGPWPGHTPQCQGRSAFGRPAPGAHPADGHAHQAAPAAARRAHRRTRPQDGF